jgi:hypothetical protein
MTKILGVEYGEKSKEQIARERLEKNKRRGKTGENWVKLKYWLKGYEMKRTGKGFHSQEA